MIIHIYIYMMYCIVYICICISKTYTHTFNDFGGAGFRYHRQYVSLVDILRGKMDDSRVASTGIIRMNHQGFKWDMIEGKNGTFVGDTNGI